MTKKTIIVVIILLIGYLSYSQHNMLGKSQRYIRSFYKLANGFSLKIDTINQESILLTYKTREQYPFFTYELNLNDDLCVSYGIVSKNTQTLETYLDMLDYLGEVINVDSTYKNFVYKIKTNEKTSYFTIKQPFIDSPFVTRRNVFYILMTEQRHHNSNPE